MLKMKDKRGDVLSMIALLVILLIIAVLGLFFFFLSWTFTDEIDKTGVLDSQANAVTVNNKLTNWIPNINDETVLFFFLAMTIGLVVAAVRTNFNPVIIFIFLLLLLVAVFIAAQSANIYRGFADEAVLSAYSSKLTFTNILFSKFTPLIIVLIGAVLLVIMYGKSGSNISV